MWPEYTHTKSMSDPGGLRWHWRVAAWVAVRLIDRSGVKPRLSLAKCDCPSRFGSDESGLAMVQLSSAAMPDQPFAYPYS